jgi:hypothetical protein
MLRRTTDVSCSMRAAMPGSLALYVDRIAKLRSRMATDSYAQSQSMLEETMRVSLTHDPTHEVLRRLWMIVRVSCRSSQVSTANAETTHSGRPWYCSWHLQSGAVGTFVTLRPTLIGTLQTLHMVGPLLDLAPPGLVIKRTAEHRRLVSDLCWWLRQQPGVSSRSNVAISFPCLPTAAVHQAEI